MKNYIPDQWVLLRIALKDGGTIDKVFAGFYGGYTTGDAWKLNSGIVETKEYQDYFEFLGYSGSTYTCYKSLRGMSTYMQGIYNMWKEEVGDKICVLD